MSDVRERPAPLSRVWSGSRTIAENLDSDDLGDVLELHSGAAAWWIVPREPGLESRLRTLARELDLDAGAVADLLAVDRRAKYETAGGTQLLIISSVSLDRQIGELTTRPMSMVITDRVLICLAGPGSEATGLARVLAEDADRLATGGASVALRSLTRHAVQSQADAVEWLDGAVDELAGTLFEARPLTRDQQLRAFRLRRAVTEVLRLTQPTLDVLTDLAQSVDASDQTGARLWTLLAERQERVVRAAEAVREALLSVFDTSLALANQRMNTDVKRLTGWAAIIAVPTLVSGFAGMNVGIPLEGTVAGFWLYLALMVITAVVLFVVFRRHDWI